MARRARITCSLTVLALTTLGAATTGCRPDSQSGSAIQTVDNFASASSLRTNACRAGDDAETSDHKFNDAVYGKTLTFTDKDIAVDTAEDRKSHLRDRVKIALTAVPQWSRAAFKSMKGQILVTPKAGAICSGAMANDKSPHYVPESAKDGVDGCIWIDQRVAGRRILSIVLADTDAAIGANLVKVFGFLHVQLYPRLRTNLGADSASLFVVDDADLGDVHKAKLDLGRRFLRELTHDGRASELFGIDGLTSVLGHVVKGNNSLFDQVRANVDAAVNAKSDDGGLFDNLSLTYGDEGDITPAARLIRGRRILDSLAANAFDSMYCRVSDTKLTDAMVPTVTTAQLEDLTDTPSVFAKLFPKTSGFYDSDVIPAWKTAASDLVKRIATYDAEQAKQKKAMSLALEGDTTTKKVDSDVDPSNTAVTTIGNAGTDSSTAGPKNDKFNMDGLGTVTPATTAAAAAQQNQMLATMGAFATAALAPSVNQFVNSAWTSMRTPAATTPTPTATAANATSSPAALPGGCPNGSCGATASAAAAGVSPCSGGGCNMAQASAQSAAPTSIPTEEASTVTPSLPSPIPAILAIPGAKNELPIAA